MTKKSTNSIVPTSEIITLTEEDRENLIELGKLRWSIDQIAIFFDWPKDILKREMEDPASEISKLFMKGELLGQYEIESRLHEDASKGNLTAAREFNRLMRDRSFSHTKLDLFGAAEQSDIFLKIQKYYTEGDPSDLGAKEQCYLDLLQIINSFDHQFGKRKTVRILTSKPYNLSYEEAANAYANAIEMFNSGRHNTKDAMRNHIADQLDTLYHTAVEKATTVKELALAGNILVKKAQLLQLDQPDAPVLPEEEYQKQYRLLSIDPGSIGLPAANRDILAKQIDELEDVPDAEKERLRMESGIEDMDITKILENVSQEESL